MQLAWRRDIDGCSNLAYAARTASSFTAALVNSSDAASVKFARVRLSKYEELQQVEVAALVNKTGHIVVAPNNPALTGTIWDPGQYH
jgi:hypothetical protein